MLSAPAFTQDQTYPFSYLRMGQSGVYSPGVVLSGDMAVSPASGLQVQIAAGEAYVQQTVARLGSFYASRGLYYIFSDGVGNPYNNISAPISNPRVDRVIARVYDVYEQQLSGSSYWRYEWVTGTETSGATLGNLSGVGALPDNSLNLAYVLQTVGESSIASGNVLQTNTSQASEWQSLTLKAGITNGGDAAIRLEGDVARLRGYVVNNSGGTITAFATVPTACIPSVDRELPAVVTNAAEWCPIEIDTSGNLTALGTFANLNTISLNGITYVIS